MNTTTCGYYPTCTNTCGCQCDNNSSFGILDILGIIFILALLFGGGPVNVATTQA